jgi:hypothetical protein
MSDEKMLKINDLQRDLSLRGYEDHEVRRLMETPVLLIPGTITREKELEPNEKLNRHIESLSRDLNREGVASKLIARKDASRNYLEERYSNIDLGTIVIAILTAQQLDIFANVSQILDLILNLIQLKFSRGHAGNPVLRTKFKLVIHNGENLVHMDIEGPSNELTKILSPSRLRTILYTLQEAQENTD